MKNNDKKVTRHLSDLPEIVEKADKNTLMKGDMSPFKDNVLELGRMLGIAQLAAFQESQSRLAKTLAIAEIISLYKAKDERILAVAPNIKTFLELYGFNYATEKEYQNNLKRFGADQMRNFERIGITIRHMRVIKILPENERDMLVERLLSPDSTDEETRSYILQIIAENNAIKETDAGQVLKENDLLKGQLELEKKKCKEITLDKAHYDKERKEIAPSWRVTSLVERLIALEAMYKLYSDIYPEQSEQFIEFRAKFKAMANRL